MNRPSLGTDPNCVHDLDYLGRAANPDLDYDHDCSHDPDRAGSDHSG
jgi:hypothetical protein